MKTWHEVSENYTKLLERRYRLQEDKTHLINKLNLTDEQKNTLIAFFKSHPNYESKVDWNNKNLTFEDFSELLSLEGNTKSSKKKYGLSGKAQIGDLVVGTDYEILLDNDYCIVYYPLTFKGSEVLARPTTPPEGVKGTWCISGRNYSPGTRDEHWNKYVSNGIDFFFVFTKNAEIAFTWQFEESYFGLNTKYAIARYPEDLTRGGIKCEMFDCFDTRVQCFDADIKPFSVPELNELLLEKENVLRKQYYSLDPETGLEYNNLKHELTSAKNMRKDLDRIIIKEGTAIISPAAFANMEYNGEIVIPDSCWRIGEDAFRGATIGRLVLGTSWYKDLQSDAFLEFNGEIVMPDNIREIPNDAFAYARFTSFKIPKSVAIIGTSAFYGCKNLVNIDMSECERLFWIKDYAFHSCEGLEKIILPSTIKYIENSAFGHCTKLKYIKLPEDFEIISSNLLRGCKSLKSIALPETIKKIGQNAFCSCRGLTSVTIPRSVETLGDNAFFDCRSLMSVYYYGTKEQWEDLMRSYPDCGLEDKQDCVKFC